MEQASKGSGAMAGAACTLVGLASVSICFFVFPQESAHDVVQALLFILGASLVLGGAKLASARSSRLRMQIVVGVLSSLVLVFFCWQMFSFTVDDAFISLRYSRHLAQGHGLSWNVGGAPVEGYTNFLWTVVLAVPSLLNVSAIAVAKCLGVVSSLVIVILTIKIAKTRFGDSMSGAIVALIFSATPLVAVHSVSGLETMPYCSLMMLSLWIVSLAAGEGSRVFWWSAALCVSCLAASLMRPDGVLMSALVLGFALLENRKRFLRCSVTFIAFYGIPAALYMTWRWHHFGWLLPNTSYIKIGNGFLGVYGLRAYLAWSTPVLILSFLGFFFRRTRFQFLVAAVVCGHLLAYSRAALIMNYGYRLFFPTFAPMLLLTIPAIERLLVFAGRTTRPRVVWFPISRRTLFSILVIATLVLWPLSYYPIAKQRARVAGLGLDAIQVRIGKALAQLPVGVVAIADAGAIPYYSDWNAVDYLGLNDVRLAHSIHDGTYLATMPAYVYGLNPDVMELASDRSDAPAPHAEGIRQASYALSQHPRFSDYDLVWSLKSPFDARSYYVLVYARKDWGGAARLRDVLAEQQSFTRK